ncbi:DUF6493 family protein [Streptomyces sp. NPDC000410]|uniref:DUF6493 family protein n=1 Tax=Streptomyces sp. NPDC000410 TaxID=3154254 RepID=UPI00332AFC82
MTSATSATSVDELLEAVRAGRPDDVPGLLRPMTTAERRAATAGLKDLRREVRGWDWQRRQERRGAQRALLLAGAGCHTGAAAAAAWIGARDLREWGSLPTWAIVDVVAAREREWLGDLAHRLAGRASTAAEDAPLIVELVRLAGCPVPTTDAFVHGWADALIGAARPWETSHSTLPVALRNDPYVRELVPRLFETVEPAGSLSWYQDPQAPNQWPSALTLLAEQGVIDRSVLVDGCVARLLRGGRMGDLRFFLILLQRLSPTPAEQRERTADWIAMAADGPSVVAGYAQEVLAGLAESGELTAGQLAEMSGAVLFRPEKKLVRAQLVLLGKVLRREAGSADTLLPVLGEAFGHEDVSVQERALKLVARHLPDGDGSLRADLAGCAALLSPMHRARAAEVFGEHLEGTDGTPYEEILPPVPVAARLAPAPDSVGETVELVSALLKSSSTSVPEFERALDGLVRHAHRDRAALAEALRPALADRWWVADGEALAHADHLYGMEIVAAAVLDRGTAGPLSGDGHRAVTTDCVHCALDGVLNARLWEAAQQILTRPVPFLLATPSWEGGSLAAEELIERLGAYERMCAEPGPVDFGQALLRVRRDSTLAPAAAALGSKEGERLAAVLAADSEAAPLVRRVVEPTPPDEVRWWQRARTSVTRIVLESGEQLVDRQDFPPVFHRLGRAQAPAHYCYHWRGREPHWPAVLPEDRETLAAWLLPDVTACATADERGGAALLPRLAEAGGPAGQGVHLMVAYGLGARHPEDRLAAVDALLTLAALGDLDGERLGRDVAELLRLGSVKPNRLADSVRTAAATGAYATTWTVLSTVLPGLLEAGTPPRGTGEILSVAADCVERCGAAVEPDLLVVPAGLAERAARGGTSQLVTQAGRLLAALRRSGDRNRTENTESGR